MRHGPHKHCRESGLESAIAARKIGEIASGDVMRCCLIHEIEGLAMKKHKYICKPMKRGLAHAVAWLDRKPKNEK